MKICTLHAKAIIFLVTLVLLALPIMASSGNDDEIKQPTISQSPPSITPEPTVETPPIQQITPIQEPTPTVRPVCGQTITENTILAEDLICSPDTQFAIVIGASDVTLDLGGHVISGYAPANGIGGIGIFAQGIQKLTIRNGTIEGFNDGIFVSETDSATIENLTIRNQNVVDLKHFITGVKISDSQNIVVKDTLFELPSAWHKDAVQVYNSDVA